MTHAIETPVLTLHDGVEVPQLGFGVFQGSLEILVHLAHDRVRRAFGPGHHKPAASAETGNGLGYGRDFRKVR